MIPIFLTGLGCKNRCTFCNQYIATDKPFLELENIKERVEESLKNIIPNEKLEIAFYGANFTGLPFKYQIEALNIIEDKLKGLDYSVRISTRPDFINEEEIRTLYKKNVRIIEIGVQSMDNEVLKLSNRAYTRKDVIKSSKIIKAASIKLSCHQMIGMPGSNLKKEIYTAKEIVKLKPDYVRIHPTLVLKDTDLYNLYKNKEYKPLSLDEAVFQTEKVFRIYIDKDVEIIRVGLYPSELLIKNIISGPWHPCFRDLVYGLYLKNNVKREVSNKVNITLEINPKDESAIRGKNNSNYNSLIQELGLKELTLKLNPKIKRGFLRVS